MSERKYLNSSSIPLSVAVFLANDNYDHEENVISATSFLKATRQLILSGRVPEEERLAEIDGLVKSRMGSAIHDSIERAWVDNYQQSMRHLGYPERVISKVIVNPLPGELKPDDIPVYLEQRAYRDVLGYRVSGKYDFVAEGRVEDFKSTSVNTYINGNKDEDYQLQGSIYRWLNPDIITQSEMAVQFIFTDWMAARARTDSNYPPRQTIQKLIPLLSVEETDAFVRRKLTELEKYKDSPEKELPLCSDKQLWRSKPKYKYYKNPEKTTRSTKNFDTKQDAYTRLAADGGKGLVKEVPGQVIACKYCDAYPICTQKDDLIAEGSLII
jgi:hypothetical protein